MELSYIFLRKVFLILCERYIEHPGIFISRTIFRTLAYLELEASSEPWYIHNSGIFRTRSIFRKLVYSELEPYSEHCQTSTMESFAKIAT